MSGNKIDTSPLVSIIMNCYNGERYLREAIESVLSQRYAKWELVFWDNQSSDDSAMIVESYTDQRICYYRSATNTPLSAARNLAIEKARGEYLAFLDSDDIWLPEKLEMQMEVLQKQSNAGISYCGFETLLTSDADSAIKQAKFYSKFIYKSHNSKSIFKKLLKGNFIIFSTVVITRSIYDLTGGFSENLEQNEDYEILLLASIHTNATCVSSKLVKYRIHSSNNSYLNARKNFTENEYILGSLPMSFDVKQAIDRNVTRKKLYFVFFEKKYNEIITLFNPKYWQHLIYLVLKKYIKL
jgi:glycosyltransferase involved in cell wall biosynthesis